MNLKKRLEAILKDRTMLLSVLIVSILLGAAFSFATSNVFSDGGGQNSGSNTSGSGHGEDDGGDDDHDDDEHDGDGNDDDEGDDDGGSGEEVEIEAVGAVTAVTTGVSVVTVNTPVEFEADFQVGGEGEVEFDVAQQGEVEIEFTVGTFTFSAVATSGDPVVTITSLVGTVTESDIPQCAPTTCTVNITSNVLTIVQGGIVLITINLSDVEIEDA